jgi:hypothetical protein
MSKKSIFWWVIFILLCIWQLPQLLVALVMWPFLGKKKLVADRHFNFCWRGSKMSGGISLGPIAYVSERSGFATIAHEVDGHTWDSKLMGPFYLLIIGIPSILNAIFDFTECYYDFFPERRANRFAKLKVDEDCRLLPTSETIIQDL